MKSQTGAPSEIAIDGTPRTYRDLKELAIYAATQLKTENPNAGVTVRVLAERPQGLPEAVMTVAHNFTDEQLDELRRRAVSRTGASTSGGRRA